MAGVIVDVNTRADSAKKDLSDINKSLSDIINKAARSKEGLGKIDSSRFKLFNKAVSDTNNNFKELKKTGESSLNGVTKSADKATGAMSGLKSAVMSLGAAFAAITTITVFHKAADDLTNIQNRLKLVITDTDNLIRTQQKLFAISKETRGNFADTASSFVDMSSALEKAGVGQQKVFKAITTIQQASALSGSSMESIRAAMMQLGQGMASGTIRGEELNSVMEQMKYLGQGVARELGLNAGSLRKFAEEGKLTTEVFLGAIEKMSARTSKDFANTRVTVGVALSQLKSTLMYSLGDFNQFYGFADRFAKSILKVSDSLNSLSNAAVGAIFVLKNNIRNYIQQFDIFSAAELTLKSAIKLEITPLDAYDTYTYYKDVKSYIDKFREFVGSQKETRIKVKAPEVELPKLKKFDLQGKEIPDEIIPTERINTLTAKLDQLKATFSELGQIAMLSGSAVLITFQNIARFLPHVVGPVITIGSRIESAFKSWRAAMTAATYDALMPFVRNLQGIEEFLTFFQTNDTRLERAWVNMFKSDSLVTFKENLKALNEQRRNIKMNDQVFLFTEAIRSLREFLHPVEKTLIMLNLMDNRLYSIRSARFDRLLKYFENIGLVVKRIYQDVFATTLEPIIAKVVAKVVAYFQAIQDALADAFNAATGYKIGNAFVNGLTKGFNAFFNGLRKLEDRETLWTILFPENTKDKVLAAAAGVFKALWEFIKGIFSGIGGGILKNTTSPMEGFAKGMYRAFVDAFKPIDSFVEKWFKVLSRKLANTRISLIFNFNRNGFEEFQLFMVNMFQKILDTTMGPLAAVEKRIASFAEFVKRAFFDIYDAVVGHSFWPDTINGVINYTTKLFETESLLTQFKNMVLKVFKEIQTSLASGSTKFGSAIIEFKARISTVDWGQAAKTFSTTIGSSIIAGFALAFGNGYLKVSAVGYFINLFNASLSGALGAFSPVLASALGSIMGDLASNAVRSINNILNDIFNLIGPFTESFFKSFFGSFGEYLVKALSLGPLLHTLIPTISGAFSPIMRSVSAVISVVTNSVTALTLAIAGLWIMLRKKGGKEIWNVLKGKEDEFGKDGKIKKKGYEGIFGFFTDKINKGKPAGKGLFAKFIDSMEIPAYGVAAGLLFASSFLEGIDFLEAAVFGIPLLTGAFLGKGAGQRIIGNVVGLAQKAAIAAYASFSKKLQELTGTETILAPLLEGMKPKPKKMKMEYSPLSNAIGNVFSEVGNYIAAIKSRGAAYSDRKIGIKDLFSLDTAPLMSEWKRPIADQLDMFAADGAAIIGSRQGSLDFGPMSNTSKVEKSPLKKAVKDLGVTIGAIKFGESTLSQRASGVGGIIGAMFNSFTERLNRLDLFKRIPQKAQEMFAMIGKYTKEALATMGAGLELLGNLFKNKWVFGIAATALFVGTANAASDATSAISALVEVVGSLAIVLGTAAAALYALGSAKKIFGAYKIGEEAFRRKEAMKNLAARGVNIEAMQAAAKGAEYTGETDARKKFKENKKARFVEFDNERIAAVEKLRNANNEKLAKAMAGGNLSQSAEAMMRKAAILEATTLNTNLKTAFKKKEALLLEAAIAAARAAPQKRIDDIIADAMSQIGSKDAKAAGRAAVFDAVKERIRGITSAIAGLIGAAGSIVAAPGLALAWWVERVAAVKNFANANDIANKAASAMRLAVAGMANAVAMMKAGEATAGMIAFAKATWSAVAATAALSKISAVAAAKSSGTLLKDIASSIGSGTWKGLKAGWEKLSPQLMKGLRLLKGPTALAGGAVLATGVLGVAIFGKGEGFFNRLEWTYDKIKSILGLEATTKTGKKFEIADQLKTQTIGGKTLDFTGEINKIDFSKVTDVQQTTLKEVAATYAETMKNLQSMEVKQGFLTTEQKTQRDTVATETRGILMRMPERASATMIASMEALNKSMLDVDNSTWVLTKRFFGWTPILNSTVAAISSVQVGWMAFTEGIKKGLGYILSTVTSWPAMIGATLGLVGGPMGALFGFTVGAMISITLDLIAAFSKFVYVATGLSDLMTKLKFDVPFKVLEEQLGSMWYALVPIILAGIGGVIGALAGGVGAPLGAALGASLGTILVTGVTGAIMGFKALKKDFVEGLSIQPTEERKKQAKALQDAGKNAANYSQFLPPEVQKLIQDTENQYGDAQARADELRAKGVTGYDPEEIKIYNEMLDKAKKDLKELNDLRETGKKFGFDSIQRSPEGVDKDIAAAEARLNKLKAEPFTAGFEEQLRRADEDAKKLYDFLLNIKQTYSDLAWENKGIEEFKKYTKEISSSAKTLLDVDMGEFGEKFKGTSEDFAKFQEMAAKVEPLKFQLSRTSNVSIRSDIQKEIDKIQEDAKLLMDKANASRNAGTRIDFIIKAGGLDTTKESLLTLFTTMNYGEEALQRLEEATRDLVKAEQELADLPLNASMEERAKAAKKVADNRKLITDLTPTSTMFGDINAKLQGLGIEQIKLDNFVGFTKGDVTQVAGLLDMLRKKNQEIKDIQPGDENAFDEIIKKMREALGLTKQIKDQIAQVMASDVKRVTESNKPLGEKVQEVSRITGEALPTGAMSSERNMKSYLNSMSKKTQAAVDMASTDVPTIIKGAKDKYSAEEALSKLEDRTKITLDNILTNISEAGIQISQTVMGSFTSATQVGLAKIGIAIESMNKQISEASASGIVGEKLTAMVNKRLDLLAAARKLMLAGMSKSGEAMKGMFDKLGLSDARSIAKIKPADMAGIQGLYGRQLEAEENLKRPVKSMDELLGRYKTLAAITDEVEALTEELAQTFEGTMSTVNEVLGTSFDLLDFERFGKGFVGVAEEMSKTLKKIKRDGVTGTDESVQDFLMRMKKMTEKGAFLTFIKSVADGFTQALTDGAKTAFERIAAMTPDFKLEFSDFAKLAPNKRREFGVEAAGMESLKKAFDLPNLSEKSAAILNSFSGDGDVTRVLADLEASLNQEGLSLKNPNVLALDNNTSATEKNTSAILQSLGIKSAGETPKQSVENRTGEIASDTFRKFYEAETNYRTKFLEGMDLNAILRGVGIDKRIANKIGNTPVAEQIKQLGIERFKLSRDEFATPEQKQLNQAKVDAIDEHITSLVDSVTRFEVGLREAANSFRASVANGFGTSLRGLLDGKKNENQSVIKTFFNGITNSIADATKDTLIKGLTERIMGPNGFLGSFFTNMGANIFGLGDLLGTKVPGSEPQMVFQSSVDVFSQAVDRLIGGTGVDRLGISKPNAKTTDINAEQFAEDFNVPTEEAFKNSGEEFARYMEKGFTEGSKLLSSGLSGILGMLGGGGSGKGGTGLLGGILGAGTQLVGAVDKAWPAIFEGLSAIFLAEGGPVAGVVNGPGTSTSDSVPAMLSKGEFVVNTAATKEHASLLTRINSGQPLRFASGGIVGLPTPSSNEAVYNDAKTASTVNNKSTVVNLNITGDISRQTKQEIMKMLPEISNGVNSYNRESNYKVATR